MDEYAFLKYYLTGYVERWRVLIRQSNGCNRMEKEFRSEKGARAYLAKLAGSIDIAWYCEDCEDHHVEEACPNE